MNKIELKEIRKALGLTQEELANKIGVTSRAVQLWEYGQRKVSKTTADYVQSLYNEQKNEQIQKQPIGTIDNVIVQLVNSQLKELKKKVEELTKLTAGLQEKTKAASIEEIVEKLTKDKFQRINENILTLFKTQVSLNYDQEENTNSDSKKLGA